MQLPPGDQASSCMTQCSTASFTCSAACDSGNPRRTCNDKCQATLSQCGGKCMQLPPGDQASSCMTQCSTASFTCSAACDSRKLYAGAEKNVERDEVEAFLAAAAKASGLTE